MKTLQERLLQKFETEYDNYMENVRQMSPETILQNLEKIAAMLDTYTFLTERGNFNDNECELLLTADHPLGDLCDQWLYNDKDISESVSQAVGNFFEAIQAAEDEDEDEFEP